MPSREEIVVFFIEAAEQSITNTVDFNKRKLFAERAARIESMRCETCVHSNPDPIASGMGYCKKMGCALINWSDGCFAHEQKLAG